jgi:hypothetical protein
MIGFKKTMIGFKNTTLDVIAAPGQLLCECQDRQAGFGFFFSSI